jgi:hypothetical protein
MVHPTHPVVSDMLVKSRQRELEQRAERERLLAVARAARPRRRPHLSAVHLLGVALVRLGTWLQPVALADRPEPTRIEASTSPSSLPS